jgi:predicted RNA-binding protein with TRAM domain
VSTKGNQQISVAFTAPVFDGGLPITTYQYALSTSNYETFITRSTGTTASPLVITGLTNGTSYGVRIRAVNSLGAGAAGVAAAEVIPSTVPNAPTNVSGTPNGVTSSTVSWTAPANTGSPRPDGGSAITGYKVEYALSPYSSYTVFSADTGNANTSIPVTGLTNGESYKFRVTAKNINGFGDASVPSGVVVTNIVPGAPTIGTMTLSTTNTTDSLAWTAPTANGGSAITGYVYQTTTNDGSTFAGALSTGSTAVSKTFDPGYTTTVRKVRVAAVNSLGTGPYSEISAVGYGGWTSSGVSIAGPCPAPNCPCPACPACPCACGTASSTGSTGTSSGAAGTSSKTCYKWTRGAQETGASYNQNSTDACSSTFSTCTAAGACSSCTPDTCGCGACSGIFVAQSPGYICTYATGVEGATSGYYIENVLGSGYIYYSDSGCQNSVYYGGSELKGTNDMRYCSVSQTWRAYGDAAITVSI